MKPARYPLKPAPLLLLLLGLSLGGWGVYSGAYPELAPAWMNGLLEKIGVGSIVFSPLEQGLLTDRYMTGTVPDGSRASEGRWLQPGPISDTYLQRVRALNDIASARGQSLAQLALLWVLRNPEVTSALIGASSVAQLESNIKALDGAALTPEEIEAIEPLAVHGTRLR